ncbi:hypothetical protein TanjilG_03142 [Lupinus angustifolius]|uniref:Aluminum-activated malate transporter n=1 Tax=Lupinus angustifolius TaxID=3871 RepID=A0A4P1RD94_LUPAN|nr:hypothetical protein TanjilG_03142 [Lupinus angustifolius]
MLRLLCMQFLLVVHEMTPTETNQNSSEGASAATKGWWQLMRDLPSEFNAKLIDVMLNLKKLGEEDPRRVIHSFKVGLAITLVSTFYYLDPLYHSFGSSAMWAVFTVIVVSEFSVGKQIAVFGDECFRTSECGESNKSFLQGYTSVLNSKQAEENLAQPEIKSKVQDRCIKMSTETGKALKELAVAIPTVTVASLLVEMVSCTDELAESIHELSSLAKFKNKDCKVAPQHPTGPKQKEAQQPFDCDNNASHHVIEINRAATNLSQNENYS